MASSPQQNEIVALQQEISAEVNRDAPAIARGIFGDNKNHPDMASVSNQQLDDLYRQKYVENDRAWLQSEARRDPNQFLDVAKRIGVQSPSQAPGAPQTVADPNALAKAIAANAASAHAALTGPGPAMSGAVPGSAPGPAALPGLPPPPVAPVASAPPPLILGPNGQPLPPSQPPAGI